MPKCQEIRIGGLSRREAERAITFLRCLNPQILTLPPKKLFDVKKWSAINGYSEKNNFHSAHSCWCHVRNSILKWQDRDYNDNGVANNIDQENNISSRSGSRMNTAFRCGSGKGKDKATEFATSATQDLDDDDDEELVSSGVLMRGRVIEHVNQEPIEIKEEDQFEVDWRNIELQGQVLHGGIDEEMGEETV